ncbi:SusC/RagA family TonB-linked outer membrane protein [Tamlana agarivorans]|uniref:SusC/RagA family TonB-linked outer membrane protein n=1 Tax=Pseudotamlana agarivorans TaxID=481183 RepID=A0ACC5U4Y2_9FLAO|nr:SusC/RagA family TonB-linked outer membrane protein [Tamlana agarivorans]MBU2949309.1 SusC/RagA family TonB-linked outer membrane protein [Tamlana agarivorans]
MEKFNFLLLLRKKIRVCIVNRNKCFKHLIAILILLAVNQNVFAQDKTVTGSVFDAVSQQPLAGATVLIKGTSNGTSTDFDGQFTLNTNSGSKTIVVSYVGYATQELAISGKTNFIINLAEDSNALNEVVITALGIKKEEKALGYAVQNVEGGALTTAPEANVLSNLTGKVAGLTVYNSTEFYTTPDISLRGETPLVVIDGVPTDTNFYNISASDIESMDVLKGATASALYGSRGAGGAIMITTKKGPKGKTVVNISSSSTFNAGFIAVPERQTVYGSGDNGRYSYVDGAGGGTNDAGTYIWGPRLDVRDSSTASGWKEISQWDSPVDPVTGDRIPTPWVSRGKDNLDSFLRPGFITTNNINVSSSSEKGTYRVSATHTFQEGQVPNTKLNNVTINVNGSTKIGAVDVQSSITYNKQFSPNTPTTGYTSNSYIYNLLVWSGVDFDVRDFKDYWEIEDVQQRYYQTTPFYNNPYFLANENLNGYYEDGAYGYLNLSWEIIEGLSVTSRTGFNSNNVRTTTNTPISQGQGLGNYSEFSRYDFTVNSDLLLIYDKEITDDFNLNVLAGATLNYNQYRSLGASTDGLNTPGFFALSNSTNPVSATNYQKQRQVNSAYGKLSLGYKNAIFLDVTGRNDWSTTLPADSQSFFYPSAALSTVISELVELPEVISFVKLRGSWTLSKEDIDLENVFDIYRLNPVYAVSANSWQGQSTASYPGTIRGGGLLPEETRSYEVGADLRFFKSRLKLDFAYFNNLTSNIISDAPVSNASGFTSISTNTKERFETRGFEVTLDATPIKTDDFQWNTLINWSTFNTYRNRLDPDFSANNYWVEEGARTDQFLIYDWERDPEGNIVHSNGFPVQSDNLSVRGFSNPDYVWAFINNVNYKDFSLSFSFDGRVGGLVHSRTEQSLWFGGAHPDAVNEYREASTNGINNYVAPGVVVVSGELTYNDRGEVINDTREFAPNTQQVSYITYQKRYNPSVFNGATEQNIFKETFAKLRELSIGYSIPKATCEDIGLSSMNINLVGRNLFLFNTDLDFVDPDRGEDDIASPSQRNIGFNIQVSF